MSWAPPPPDRDRERDHLTGPTDAAPWSVPPIPAWSPTSAYGQPEDTPPTRPAPPPQLRYADWGERVAATLVDWSLLFGIIVVLGVVGGIVEPLEDLAGFAWLASLGYLAWLNGAKGQSPGKALLGLKVVREADGSPLGGFVGLVRGGLLGLLSLFTVGIFFLVSVLWPFRDPKQRAVHDLVVSAVVVSGYPKAPVSPRLLKP